MDVTPLVREGAQIIQSYSNGGFRVSGQGYDGAVMVLHDCTQCWDFDGDVSALCIDDFSALVQISDDVDVVLLGTGAAMVFPDAKTCMALKQGGLNVEVMDTGAACRTYNVLMAEGRRVVAALLPF